MSWDVDVVVEDQKREDEKGGLSICCWQWQRQWQCLHVMVISLVKLLMNDLK